MLTGSKPIFVCQFTIHFNVKYKVALHIMKYEENLSLSGILWNQYLFPLKFTLVNPESPFQ